MLFNKARLPFTDMTLAQFREWLRSIVNEALFLEEVARDLGIELKCTP